MDIFGILCGIGVGYLFTMVLTGFTPQYIFRSREDRDFSKLLTGALAMGPEGYKSDDGLVWNLVNGDITIYLRLESPYSPKSLMNSVNSGFIKIGEQHVEFEYSRDLLRVDRAAKRWNKRRLKLIRTAEFERLQTEVVRLKDGLDKVDQKVVAQRSFDMMVN